MNDIQENLKKISYKDLNESEQSTLWHNIRTRKDEVFISRPLIFSLFNLKPMAALFIALIVLFGGGGTVVALADASRPGDALFGVDLATERVQLALATKEVKREALIEKFAKERIKEVESFQQEKPVQVDEKFNLQGQTITEMEAEVFTNETVVKIEANDKKYGFTTNLKEKTEIVSLIVVRYSLEQSVVESKLVFKTEDRASRPEDKGFLNGKSKRVDLSEDEKNDFEHGVNQALNQINKNNNISPELKSALEALLSSSGERKIEIERDGQEIKIESKNGEIKVKIKIEDKDSEKNNDLDSDDDNSNSEISNIGDDDSDDENISDDDSDDGNSGSGGGGEDDDNGGSGKGDDDEEDND